MRIAPGSTDVSVWIRISDATDGTPETGVTSATPGLALRYQRTRGAVTSISPSDLAAVDSAHSDGGLKHVGDGYYRLDLPDAAVASGAAAVLVSGTATDMVVTGDVIDLVIAPDAALAAYDPPTHAETTAAAEAAKLAADGVDAVTVATGVNLREAARLLLAADFGETAGMGTTTATIKDFDDPDTNVATATVDGDGNRSSITVTVPE